jgi:histidine triad (HIT) family protein
MATIFTRIIKGEIPSLKVYEDEHVYAFLDINPLAPGHTMVIPKEEKAFLHELSDESAAAIGRVLPRLCRAVMTATGVSDYNVLQNNGGMAHQVVMHVHFHIIPKPDKTWGLGIHWPSDKLDPALGAEMARSIADAMK